MSSHSPVFLVEFFLTLTPPFCEFLPLFTKCPVHVSTVGSMGSALEHSVSSHGPTATYTRHIWSQMWLEMRAYLAHLRLRHII